MNGVDSEGAHGVFLRPRGPSLWATAILTPLPGQTTKITFCIVFNAVGHFFWADERAWWRSRKRRYPRRGHGLSMPVFVPSSEGKYYEEVVKQAVFGPRFSRSLAIFFKGG